MPRYYQNTPTENSALMTILLIVLFFFFNYSWGNSCSFQRSQWELCMILRSDGSILNAPYCSNSEHREYRNEKRLQAVSGLHQSQQGKGMLYPVLFVK